MREGRAGRGDEEGESWNLDSLVSLHAHFLDRIQQALLLKTKQAPLLKVVQSGIFGAQAANGVLAAAISKGGDEKNIEPALLMFAEIAKQGRLSLSNPTIATMEKGEIEVGVVWDFNGLSYRDKMVNPDDYEVLIPSDGSVISGYTTIINKYAKHPNAAKLAREYIFSDAGQTNLARGNARPIRAEHITLPADVQAKLLPNEQYKHVKPIADADAWEKTSKSLPKKWNEQVIIEMK